MFTRYLIHLYSDLFCRVHVLFVLYVFSYVYRCPTRFPYQAYVSFTIVTIGATRGTGPTYRSETHTFTPLFSGYRITLSIVPCSVCYIDHCFCLCVFFLLPLCASFELRPLIIHLISS